jgi:hypothetical protein
MLYFTILFFRGITMENYLKQLNKAKRLLSTAQYNFIRAYEKSEYTSVEEVNSNKNFVFVYFGDGSKKVFKR